MTQAAPPKFDLEPKDGVPNPANEEPAEPDYFGGSQKREKWYLPKSKTQYVEFKIMNEGDRKRWQKRTSRDVKVSRKDQSAAISMDIAQDREELLISTVVDWTVIDPTTGRIAQFNNNGSGGLFMQWCNRMPPELIDKLELAIRDAHPWMQDEMDPDSIQEEIDRLYELKAKAEARKTEKENF